MKKSGKLFVLFAVVTGIFLFNNCSKEESNTLDVVSKTTVKDYLNMVNSFALFTEEEVASSNNDDLKSAQLLDCLTVTVHENEDGEFWPRSWTLDYGTENCECYCGNSKRGKIHVSLSDWWRNDESLREMTFEDYYFNDNKIEGKKSILNTGINENGNLSFTRKVSDAKIIYQDGSEMSWDCEKFSELIEGGESFIFADDVWSVTGSGSGKNLDGNEYTMTITSPLIYKNGCFYPVSGIIEIDTDGEGLKIIDYGNEECDNVATVTINGNTENVEL